MKNAILDFYQESSLQDHGKSLSIKDMTQIARQLETLTSNAYRFQVGGFIQVATIINGKAELTDPFPMHFATDDLYTELNPARISSLTYFTADHSTNGIVGRGRGPYTPAILAIGANLAYIGHQPLDNILFFASTFDHVTLTYNGDPVSFFDKTNKVSDCTLVIGKNVDLSSPTVVQIRKNFPSLLIKKENQSDGKLAPSN